LDCEQLLQQSVTSSEAQVSVSPPREPGLFSPIEIRPFPSAPPRKVSGRRTGKTRILTDTPVKNELAQRQRQKASKGSSEKESVGQEPSCSTALFGSSRKRSVAHGKKKAAKKPSVADAEKDDPPRATMPLLWGVVQRVSQRVYAYETPHFSLCVCTTLLPL